MTKLRSFVHISYFFKKGYDVETATNGEDVIEEEVSIYNVNLIN